MKARIIFCFFVVLPLLVYAATRNVGFDGNWTNSGIWTGGIIATPVDDVTFSNNVDATIQNGDNITVLSISPGNNGSLTIEAGGILTLNNSGMDAFTINNGFTLNIVGDLIINGNLAVNNNLVLNVTGTLTVNGNIVMNNGAGLDVTSTGKISVSGDFTGGNNTAVKTDGIIDVDGTVKVGTGSTLAGTGSFVAGGSCTDGGSTFCESSTLPVVLVSFSHVTHNDNIELIWSTYSQENFDYFSLERSPDGLSFESIAEISGITWSNEIINYSYNDYSPFIGRSYYRLKAVDLDGSSEYFNIITVNYKSEAFGFSVYPNPVRDYKIKLELNFVPNEMLMVEIIDLNGRVVLQSTMNEFESTIELSSLVRGGMYLIRLTSQTGMRLTERLVVN